MGNPDRDRICTSHVERQNLTMRMQMRRLTRLTNAFSKKWANLKAALAVYFAWYNFCRVHRTIRMTPVMGNPDRDRICTSHVERQNLTMRMQMRRLTRLTNAFSKKWANLKAALAVYFAWYNFCRVHRTIRMTPAMEAGIEDRIWTIGDLLV